MKSRPVLGAIGEMLWDVYPDAAHFGGAPANFAAHAASLGAESWMVSAVGMDDLGEKALQLLQERNVLGTQVTRDREHPTGQVRVTLNAAAQASYEFIEDPAWDHLPWTEALSDLARRCDAVCFGSLAQRAPTSRDTIRRFLQATRPGTLRVFDVNLRQRFYSAEVLHASLELASAVKLNDEELPVVAEFCGLRATQPLDQLKELADRFQLRLAALTRGAQGSLLLAEGRVDECPAPATEVVDTVGAGDAFTATLVTDFLGGVPLETINRHANAVAAYVCSQRGATPTLPAPLRLP
jgi:fructokinase